MSLKASRLHWIGKTSQRVMVLEHASERLDEHESGKAALDGQLVTVGYDDRACERDI